MKYYHTVRPIGLDAVCSEIEANCAKAVRIRQTLRNPDARLLKPAPCLIQLDPGNGRTTLVEYAADRYREDGVLDFTSGMDDYVELVLDGSYMQFHDAMRILRDAATYKSDYEGIVLLDAAAMVNHSNEKQYREFFAWFKDFSKHACVFCFMPEKMNGAELAFAQKLMASDGRFRHIVPSPYTPEELAGICEKHIRNYGIDVACPQSVLQELVCSDEIKVVKDVILLADNAVQYANFESSVPSIDVPQIKMMTDSIPSYGKNGGLQYEQK